MTGLEKILTEHRARRAFVYARQSTPAQVIQHRSSTERQIGLADLAAELGWSTNLIDVVTDDLGQSGRFVEGREGFQRLAAEMTMGRVGAVFSLDASRLARSSADWYRLLEIAALTRTLLVDEQSVYDPRDPNDRLILGMKGTMADFELVWLRQRMEGGRWHLAKKGAYRFRPAAGYVYEDDESTRFVFDPDEEVQRAIKLLFERYRTSGTSNDVVNYFARNQLRFPARYGKRLEWNRLNHSRVHAVLSNPIYTGAYVFGRMRGDTVLDQGRRRRRVQELPIESWRVTIRDAHPAYISWEEFLTNQKRMTENSARRRGALTQGAAREGRALLQGLLLCGRCGSRIKIRYSGTNGHRAVYWCDKMLIESLAEKPCLTIGARNLEEPIIAIVFAALTRERLIDATRVVELVEEQDAALDRQWQLRLERARYDAKRAERQFDACEPENRVVARTLERRWNEKLTELETLEGEYTSLKDKRRVELTDVDRERILQLAADLPRLWRASSTSDRDRKLLLRSLIKDVSIRPIEVPRSTLQTQILWHTGAITDVEIDPIGQGSPRRPIQYRVGATRVVEAPATRAAALRGK
jgi:DNA invertase Pin-like site-specific DNA recombinase